MAEKKKIRVLVVDDMAVTRNIIAKGLGMDPGIEVVATASDPYSAREMIAQYRPDVITLDLEMPRMNGLEFLRKLMPQYPLPVIIVSSFSSEKEKLVDSIKKAGAVDYVMKPQAGTTDGGATMIMELRTKVKLASTVDVSHFKAVKDKEKKTEPSQRWNDFVIAIGASTGGTEAI